MAGVPKAYLAAVAAASTKYKVPAQLLAAQIQAESNWNPNAHSGAGAIGISQFMPGTAAGYHIDPHNPFQSIDAQGKMMSSLLKSYHGDARLALAAYNAGAGAVANAGGKVPNIPETQNYVKTVLSNEGNYPGLAKGTVERAGAYSNILSGLPTGSQTAPKASSGSGQGNLSSKGYDPAQALTGYLINQSTQGPGNHDSTGELLNVLNQTAAAQATQNVVGAKPGTTKATVPSSVSPTSASPSPIVGNGDKYKLIGVPYQGTHTLYGNWESDNAIDIAVPGHTPVYATESGVIGSNIGHINTSDSHMAGQRVNLTGKDNSFYYQHLQTINVKAGQHVKKGDLLGYSGALNHVHFAVEKGDPRNYYK